MRLKRQFVFSIFAAAILLLGSSTAPVFAQACPLCKLSLIHSPEGRHMARAFNDGILFLLSMPYVLGVLIALSLWMLRRKRA